MTDLGHIRREYLQGGLRRKDLPDDPMQLFELWMQQACDAQLMDPSAMCIATVDESGQPYQRIVLLKQFDQNGFVFFTNLSSRKAQHLANNNKINLHFPWHMMERQVSINATASQLSHLDVMRYFLTRPKESQIAAWVSKQSSSISARRALLSKFNEMKQKFADGEVPLPKFWGGYRVKPHSIEFWQGGEYRLHDRFIYQQDESNQWTIDRLAP